MVGSNNKGLRLGGRSFRTTKAELTCNCSFGLAVCSTGIPHVKGDTMTEGLGEILSDDSRFRYLTRKC